MSLLSKKAVVLLLTAVASLGALNAQAATATDSNTSSTQKVSMLDGKFTFTLPKGFIANTLPASPDGAIGTMYTNEATKTVVIAAENNLPERRQRQRQRRRSFSTGRPPISKPQQRQALPDFNKLSEKSLTQKGQAWACVRSTAPPPRVAA